MCNACRKQTHVHPISTTPLHGISWNQIFMVSLRCACARRVYACLERILSFSMLLEAELSATESFSATVVTARPTAFADAADGDNSVRFSLVRQRRQSPKTAQGQPLATGAYIAYWCMPVTLQIVERRPRSSGAPDPLCTAK
jgi:hypothetical protein